MGVALVGYNGLGKPIRKYVSAKTRTAVVQKLKTIRSQIDDGLPVADSGLKVAQLFERWHEDVLRHQVGASASSNYMSVATHHIVPTLGNKKVVDLTVTDVDRLLSKKLDGGLSVSTVRRIRSVFAQCLDQGLRWGLVNRNVATLSRAPREARKEGRTITPDQARQLLEFLKGRRNEALWVLMLSTGLRRGEALGLMWSDFDRDSGVLRVRRQLKREGDELVVADTKTARSRRAVNLPAPMIELLVNHEQRQRLEKSSRGDSWIESGHIFTSSVGTPIDPRNLYREFQTICQEAGLGRWHPHELRHSAASLMLAQGVKIQVVSQVLGHASIRMTADVYGHILDPEREAAANAMGSVLWGDGH